MQFNIDNKKTYDKFLLKRQSTIEHCKYLLQLDYSEFNNIEYNSILLIEDSLRKLKKIKEEIKITYISLAILIIVISLSIILQSDDIFSFSFGIIICLILKLLIMYIIKLFFLNKLKNIL